MNYQSKVKEFMIISGQAVSDEPRQLTQEEYDFRDSLLREEIRELQYAIVDNNRVEILDALCDIKYVNDGTANMMGVVQWDDEYMDFRDISSADTYEDLMKYFEDYDLSDPEYIDSINHSCIVLTKVFGFTIENFKIALDRVHSSNMSKFCLDTKTVERTQEFYAKQGIETYVEPKEKVTVVYRKGDGKVLKSVEYFPVQLKDLV